MRDRAFRRAMRERKKARLKRKMKATLISIPEELLDDIVSKSADNPKRCGKDCICNFDKQYHSSFADTRRAEASASALRTGEDDLQFERSLDAQDFSVLGDEED